MSCRPMDVVGMTVMGMLAHAAGACAFPLFESDATDRTVAAPSELAAPDARDLQHQLALGSGVRAPAEGGWTFLPRLGLAEAFDDNLFQVASPRRADLTTLVSPGFSLIGDTARLQLTADYSPTLEINAINGSQNAVTQQLNAVGLLTLVPNRLFVDLRALAGVQATDGLVGGYGSLGTAGPATAYAGGGGIGGGGLGLSKFNRTQTASVGISPYVVGRVGEYGRFRAGASLDVAHYSSAAGFITLPFAGSNAETVVTTQQMAHYDTGDYFAAVQDQVDLNLSQSQTTSELAGNGQTGGQVFGGNSRSTRETLSDQVTWHYNQSFAFFASLGWENIRYRGTEQLSINGPTWSIGTNWTPSPDSLLTISYGHREGADSLAVDARYALTGRTLLSASYSNTVGTQLQNVQRQLDLAAAGTSGRLINGQTGGTLFNGNNLLGVQPGLYRFNTVSLSSITNLDRDTLSFGIGYSRQTGIGSGRFAGTASEVGYGTGQWIHALTPVMTLSGALSYTRQQYSGTGGNAQSIAASAALQYSVSETVTTSARYMFFDRIAALPGQNLYQDLFILGVTKQF
jgi:uncharacterized protein (PEP-CTERM system associated)